MGYRAQALARAAALAAVLLAAPRSAEADSSEVYGRVRITRADAAADARLAGVRSALTRRVEGSALRVLSVGPRPDDSSRFEATLYDDAREQGIVLVLDESGAELGRAEPAGQPEIANEEVRDALELVARASDWAAGIAAGSHVAYEAMPPVTTDKHGRRLVNVGVMALPDERGHSTENEIVSVHLPTGQIVRNEGGAPATALAPEAVCGPPNQSCGAPPGDCAAVFHFEWPAVDPVWKFDALHPSCTNAVQGDGTGLELRNVKYLERLILKTAHVPVLNVEYVGNVCGPYRDWLDTENCFATSGAPVGTTGFAVSSGAPEPLTFCESGSDAGNFVGAAIHDAGDHLLLMTEASAGWYRYMISYRLHLDGTFEPRMGFGATANGCTCNAHTHHAYWRFEFALDGSEADPATGIASLARRIPGSLDEWAPVPVEAKLDRPAAGWSGDQLRIRNPATGTQYTLIPGAHDGSAAGNAFARGDTWALAYNAGQINDPNPDEPIAIDGWANGEALGDLKRLVLWYRMGYFHDHPVPEIEPCEILSPTLRFRRACRGEISLARETFGCADVVAVVVDDNDLVGAASQAVTVRSPQEPAGESILLVETPPGSGRFEGTIATTADAVVPADGVLSVAHGGSIQIDYDDADACGTQNVVVERTVAVDCAPPVLSNLRAEAVTDTTARIAWETGEPADGEAAYGTAPPPSATQAGAEAFGTSHTVLLAGLSECTQYLYSATSRDGAGNAATDDNGGAYRSFETFGRRLLYGPDDVEGGGTGWSVSSTGGSAWHVTDCRSDSAIHSFKAGSSTGCPGSYAPNTNTYLTSPVIALGAGSAHRLRFDEFVSMQSGNDKGRVQISSDAGLTWTTVAESTGSSSGWQERSVDLAAYAGLTVELRFWFHSDASSAIEGWYVDDIEITKATPCGAHLTRALSPVASTCPAGGTDAAIDPGEDVVLTVVARNIGLAAATGVSATLAAATPGVYLLDATATFPDVAAEDGTAVSDPPHFAFTVPGAAACPSVLDFVLHFASDQGAWSEPLSLPTGSGGPATYVVFSSTTPVAVPDASTLTDSVTVASTGEVTDVNVAMSLTHPYDADLDVFLVAPDGTRIELATDNGASGNDYTGTTFDDEAAGPIASAAAPFNGSFRPEGSLAALDGISAAGTWTLEVTDDAAPDSGSLDFWSVTVATIDPPTCAECAVAAPGEVQPVTWPAVDVLEWIPVAEGRWYEVLRGDSSTLAALADAAPDACIRWTGTPASTGPILGEVPGEADPLLWYLVTAWNGAGRGGAGAATTGPRVVDPEGPCP